jgi:hypothetical protein
MDTERSPRHERGKFSTPRAVYLGFLIKVQCNLMGVVRVKLYSTQLPLTRGDHQSLTGCLFWVQWRDLSLQKLSPLGT